MTDPLQPHDALFRALLGDPERAGPFLRENLPNNITAHLSDRLPIIVDGSFVDEALAKSQSDILLQVETKSGTTAFVYALIEHKSYPDHMVPLQLAIYMTRIWRRHIQTRSNKPKKGISGNNVSGSSKTLPPIIPMVLYHGKQRWTVPDGLEDMIAANDPALVVLPGQSYIFRDLGQIDDEALSQHRALRAGLLALKRVTVGVLARAIAEMHHERDMVEGGPYESEDESDELISQILTYILRTYEGLDLPSLQNELGQHNRRLEALVGTIAETLLQKGEERGEARGIAEGEARGKAEGEARGKAEGEAKSLVLLLESRFGTVPGGIKALIDNANIDELDIWFRKALKASMLEEVFHKRQ